MMGGDPNGVPFHVFCYEEWKSKYGTSPPWGKKEYSQLAEAHHRLDTEELARSTWNTFLASTDSFHEGHSPGQFLWSLSKMTARAVKAISKQPEQTENKALADRARIMREVYTDPAWSGKTELEKRTEYARRAREL